MIRYNLQYFKITNKILKKLVRLNMEGEYRMKKSDEKLLLKKQTLKAWTGILLAKGMIDLAKYNRMISKIDKLTA